VQTAYDGVITPACALQWRQPGLGTTCICSRCIAQHCCPLRGLPFLTHVMTYTRTHQLYTMYLGVALNFW
jgi:hypothetical protein